MITLPKVIKKAANNLPAREKLQHMSQCHLSVIVGDRRSFITISAALMSRGCCTVVGKSSVILGSVSQKKGQ